MIVGALRSAGSEVVADAEEEGGAADRRSLCKIGDGGSPADIKTGCNGWRLHVERIIHDRSGSDQK